MKWFLLMLVFAISPVMADDDSDSDSDEGLCSHPHFVTYDCLDSYGYDDGSGGADGTDGSDGENGAIGPVGPAGETGAQGEPGPTGATGAIGPAGPTGPPGRDFSRYYSQYLAATEAAQVYLPQNKSSRMTFGMSRVNGQTGIGLGYAFKANTDDAAAFTLSLGFSGGKAVGKASVSVEF